jgi:DNA-binding HxlR family transcriptional regulator
MSVMPRRSYRQYCGLAEALDLLGERWTILILRDLLLGPKRFTDLLDRLTGIGTGLLSQRLRELESAGIIEKTTLPPPAASTVYQLTPDGDELRPVLLGLIRWGAKRLGEPNDGQPIDAESLALSLTARLESAPPIADATFEFRITGQPPVQVRATNNRVTVATAFTDSPDAVVAADADTLIALNNGTRSLADAVADGSVSSQGEPATLRALTQAYAN